MSPQPLAKNDDEIPADWELSGADSRTERCGEGILIVRLRDSSSGRGPHTLRLLSNDCWMRRFCTDVYLQQFHLFSVVSYCDLLLECQHNLHPPAS